jgi:cytochrome c
VQTAQAQLPFALPAAPPTVLDPATQFANQCGLCHALTAGAQRLGPNLHGVFGRHAGAVPGFSYSPGFAAADWNWDAARLDAWLADPQAMIPGTVMTYRQADPAIRQAIIAYLKEQP